MLSPSAASQDGWQRDPVGVGFPAEAGRSRSELAWVFSLQNALATWAAADASEARSTGISVLVGEGGTFLCSPLENHSSSL